LVWKFYASIVGHQLLLFRPYNLTILPDAAEMA
jgi:hypothetical protein